MLFNSFHFLIFFAAVVALHFGLPHRWRWAALLAASCYFYAAYIPAYLLVLGLSIAIDYVAGIWIERSAGARRRALLVVSIVANVGLLAFFKYFGFLDENLAALASLLGWHYGVSTLAIALPIGLSFHTFQAMAYTIEVYRGNQPAERHFGRYALYVMFFPQLVAGPIERPQNLLHQFRQVHRPDAARWRSGLQLMLWGLFKKVAVADQVAPVVNAVYAAPTQFSGPLLVLATFLFAVQIYCDFSGYSDIAIGSARLLGYDLMQNFRQPYFARSIGEFWHRWHISLSTWFRDYLYIPLGGNRVTALRLYGNILLVFALSGLWHGAAWTFVAWGILHGTYLVLGRVLAPWRARLATTLSGVVPPALLGVVQTLWVFALVLVAWVFFRANSLGDAGYVLSHALRFAHFRWEEFAALGVPRFDLALGGAMILSVAVTDWVLANRPARVIALWERRPWRWACLAACFYAIACFGVFDKAPFIYFQF